MNREPWRLPPAAPSLPGDEVHLWLALVDQADLAVPAGTLSDDEMERAQRFRFERDRARFVASRAILRDILGRYLDIAPGRLRFGYSATGKPFLQGPGPTLGLSFNLSHSEGVVLYAVGRGRAIGVDVERVRAITGMEQVARLIFAEPELTLLDSLPEAQRVEAFFNGWTRKEAYVKATGDGIGRAVNRIVVSLVPGQPAALLRVEDAPDETSHWSLRAVTPVAGYAGALATEGRPSTLACWRWGRIIAARRGTAHQPVAGTPMQCLQSADDREPAEGVVVGQPTVVTRTEAPERVTSEIVEVPAVSARGLTKVFERGRRTLFQRVRRQPDRRERFRAVDSIDFRVEAGEIFGVLGPNGAGKTTTLRMLATLLEPSEGEARLFGLDVRARPREARKLVGALLSGERSLYWKLTGRENLEYFAALYHVPARETRRRIDSVLEAVELSERADDYTERYSTGMRQRLALARVLLPNPPLLLLDEPTVGLDPQAANHMRDSIRSLRAQGRTVLLTTHYMEEADALCDRIAIIDHGRIVAMGTPAELKRTVRGEQVVRLEVVVGTDDRRFLAELEGRAVLAWRQLVDGQLAVTLHCASARDFLPFAFDAARAAGVTIQHVEVVPVTLEEVFLTLTGRALRD